MRIATLLVLILCACRQGSATPPTPVLPDLALEITPVALGAHTPGDVPPVTVAIINRSKRAYVLPELDWQAHQGFPGTVYFEYERALPDGTWEPQSRTFFTGHSRHTENLHRTLELPPGARVVLDPATIPPMTFADDVTGKMRARLVYDVDAEWKRRTQTAPHIETIKSNVIEIDQIAGPLEVTLEPIGPVTVGKALDLPRVLRVMVRNRLANDVTILGPGEHSGMGFDIYKPNGGVWPKGARPVMEVAPGPGRSTVLRPGEVIEVFGPRAALGPAPGTWTLPVAETFRLRANFYQPMKQRFHYSDWVTIQAAATP